jgi:hypothetical protein
VPNTHYSVENFAGTPPAGSTITQTQAIGINNKDVPVIVGFWADQNGLNFGFEDVKGVFTTILDPNATFAGNQNLLGVNDFDEAAAAATNTVSLLAFIATRRNLLKSPRSLMVRSRHRRAASTTRIRSADSGLMPTAMTTAFSARSGAS